MHQKLDYKHFIQSIARQIHSNADGMRQRGPIIEGDGP